jgi:hypothetical protein
MANYQKTQELFEKEQNRTPNLKYEKSPAQLKEENWLASVTKSDGTVEQIRWNIYSTGRSKGCWCCTYRF